MMIKREDFFADKIEITSQANSNGNKKVGQALKEIEETKISMKNIIARNSGKIKWRAQNLLKKICIEEEYLTNKYYKNEKRNILDDELPY